MSELQLAPLVQKLRSLLSGGLSLHLWTWRVGGRRLAAQSQVMPLPRTCHSGSANTRDSLHLRFPCVLVWCGRHLDSELAGRNSLPLLVYLRFSASQAREGKRSGGEQVQSSTLTNTQGAQKHPACPSTWMGSSLSAVTSACR